LLAIERTAVGIKNTLCERHFVIVEMYVANCILSIYISLSTYLCAMVFWVLRD